MSRVIIAGAGAQGAIVADIVRGAVGFVDDVQEPGTLVLLSTGLAGVSLAAWRRNRRR